MTSQHSVVFAEPVRTAIGTFGGSLKDVPAPNFRMNARTSPSVTSRVPSLSTIKRVSFADHPQAVFMALASRGCGAVYALPRRA